jgi:hypothetical protein
VGVTKPAAIFHLPGEDRFPTQKAHAGGLIHAHHPNPPGRFSPPSGPQ